VAAAISPRRDRYGRGHRGSDDEFHDDVATALGPTVWNTGCNSWYLTDEGNVDLWPYDRKTMTAMLTTPDDRDFHVTRAVPAS